MADGIPLLLATKLEGRLKLINCGGIPSKVMVVSGDRIPIHALKLSKAGFYFIKGWESFGDPPYDDSKHFCTVGRGHLIAKQSCSSLAAKNNPEFEKYKNGISAVQADQILDTALSPIIEKVSLFVQVPFTNNNTMRCKLGF